MCAGMLFAEESGFGGKIRVSFGEIKPVVLPSIQGRFTALSQGGTMSPRSPVPLPMCSLPQGFTRAAQPSRHPEIFPFDFQFLFSPLLLSSL